MVAIVNVPIQPIPSLLVCLLSDSLIQSLTLSSVYLFILYHYLTKREYDTFILSLRSLNYIKKMLCTFIQAIL